jgi:hypothetical protein
MPNSSGPCEGCATSTSARARPDSARLDEVDQRRHRLSFVDRVGEYALQPGAETDRVGGPRVTIIRLL